MLNTEHSLQLSFDLAGGPSELWLRKCFVHVCVFNFLKDSKNHSRQSYPKSIHYVLPHVLSMNTTCCWSTARKIRLSKSLVASLQYTSLAACLSCSLCVCSCTNTHINTHIKPHTYICSGQYETPSFKYSSR